MTKEMMINTVEGHECRIAVIEDGVLEELYIERVSSASRVGNIYKGRITNVEPAIQAAFIDFGFGKNGFLHISDVNPQYFPRGGGRTSPESVGRKHSHRDRPPIQECLRRGQEVIVQMTKEGIGTKGPTLTTYLSIPGRLLVMMPGMSRLGVSRKIQDEQARQAARQILQELNVPADMGFIVRTAGIDRPKRELQRDLNYLTRLWKSVERQTKAVKAPAEIYQESDLVIRTIRDVYNADIERIICDNQGVALKVQSFLDMAMPRGKHTIELYTGKEGLFHEFGLEHEIEKIYSRRVELDSGGWLAIDQAEALVAIDVNSGRFREHSDAETTALKINQEAAGQIARQLRLRDMGGVIIIDFIDMYEEKNRRAVERSLRDAIKKDRAKTKVLRISPFGIVEMTRQRVRPSLRDSMYRRCAFCDGSGLIKSEESQALGVMRSLQRAVCNEDIAQVELAVTPAVEFHLSNRQRRDIAELEANTGKRITIRADASLRGDEIRVTCTNSRGNTIPWDMLAAAPAKRDIATINIQEIEPSAAPAEGELEFPEGEGELEVPTAATSESDMHEFEERAGSYLEGDEFDSEGQEVQPDVEEEALELTPPPAASAPSATPAPTGAAQAVPRPQRPPQAQAPAGGPAGAPGQGKRRRRGRRGGQRHRRKGQAAGAVPGQPTGQGQPPSQAQGQASPQGQARPSQAPAPAQPRQQQPRPAQPQQRQQRPQQRRNSRRPAPAQRPESPARQTQSPDQPAADQARRPQEPAGGVVESAPQTRLPTAVPPTQVQPPAPAENVTQESAQSPQPWEILASQDAKHLEAHERPAEPPGVEESPAVKSEQETAREEPAAAKAEPQAKRAPRRRTHRGGVKHRKKPAATSETALEPPDIAGLEDEYIPPSKEDIGD